MVKSSVLRCCLKALPFLLILLYILAVVVPYIEHKEVSPEYRAAFEDRRFYGTGVGPERAAYIDNNKDALFCRMNLIGNAEEEITSRPSISMGTAAGQTWSRPFSVPRKEEFRSVCWWTAPAVFWM